MPIGCQLGRKEEKDLFNNTLKAFLFIVRWLQHMVKENHIKSNKTHCHHFMNYYFKIARDLLYAVPQTG